MGRLTRWLVASGLSLGIAFVSAGSVGAFDGFGDVSADATYGVEISFGVELPGGRPDRLELLLRTPGSDADFVVPVTPGNDGGRYVWDTSIDYVTPNTPITYRWRATDAGETTLSEPATVRYDDDRPGLEWRSERMGQATVHWYGGGERQARRFGELTALGVERAEELLGTRLAGPVDVFVYDSREDFFGALGPGAREWTGAAAFAELRTIFMWLEGGSPAYLETAMVHEVTHIVFHDATDNPFHEPARWFNEGVATWLETSDADAERASVELEASGGGLFAFEAITEQFPIGDRGGRLSYAQGTVMIDLIVDRYGPGAIGAIAAAYRGGASDEEALEAGTGIPASDLYAEFYAEFAVAEPEPVPPEPIAASNVERPPAGAVDQGGLVDGPDAPRGEPAPDQPPAAGANRTDDAPLVWIVITGVAAASALLVARLVARRARTREGA